MGPQPGGHCSGIRQRNFFDVVPFGAALVECASDMNVHMLFAPLWSARVADPPVQRLLRQRPLVFISSAIAGLTGLRARIAERLEALDLADQWLFELHTTAAGEPAEAHYLDIARSCDLMVVIVGDRRTEGTEDEYDEALLDPDKILPFFLGDGNDEVKPFRAKLEQPNRHLRKKVYTEDELVDVVVRLWRQRSAADDCLPLHCVAPSRRVSPPSTS